MGDIYYLVNHCAFTAFSLNKAHPWLPDLPAHGTRLSLDDVRKGFLLSLEEVNHRLIGPSNPAHPDSDGRARLERWLDDQGKLLPVHQHHEPWFELVNSSRDVPWDSPPIYPEWIIHDLYDDSVRRECGYSHWKAMVDPENGSRWECLLRPGLWLRFHMQERALEICVNHLRFGTTKPVVFPKIWEGDLDLHEIKRGVLGWYIKHHGQLPRWFRILDEEHRHLAIDNSSSMLDQTCRSCGSRVTSSGFFLGAQAGDTARAWCSQCLRTGGLVELQPNKFVAWIPGHPIIGPSDPEHESSLEVGGSPNLLPLLHRFRLRIDVQPGGQVSRASSATCELCGMPQDYEDASLICSGQMGVWTPPITESPTDA